MPDRMPCALVGRFFLTPNDFLEVRIKPQLATEVFHREGVELFDADDGDMAKIGLTVRGLRSLRLVLSVGPSLSSMLASPASINCTVAGSMGRAAIS